MNPSSERLVSAPFVVVTLATGVFFIFVGMAAPVLPRFVEEELGGGGTEIGLTIAVFSLAAIAVRPLIGWLGDVAGRRALMVGGALLGGIGGGLVGLAPNMAVLLALRAVSGIGEAAVFVGSATLVADLSPPDRRAEGASYFSVAVFGGVGIGPIVGEWVLGDDRWVRVFAIGSVFCVLSAAIAMFAPGRPVTLTAGVDAGTDAGAAVGGPPRRGFHSGAFGPGVVLASGIATMAAFIAFIPTYADDLGMDGVAGVFVVYSIVNLSVRVGFARLPERLGLARTAAAALTALGTGAAIAALVRSPAGLYAGTVVLALGTALLYPALLAAAVNPVPENERAQVISTFTMFFEIGTIAGGLVLGPIVAASTERAAFVGGTVFAVTGIVLLRTWVLPRVARAELRVSKPSHSD